MASPNTRSDAWGRRASVIELYHSREDACRDGADEVEERGGVESEEEEGCDEDDADQDFVPVGVSEVAGVVGVDAVVAQHDALNDPEEVGGGDDDADDGDADHDFWVRNDG